ncbi:MAG: hypothetical protein TREMPRED_003491 [Tremellales sp. Tagirdzhanova-0007]|nr:MAG: hypothetical protein TREMPRED_003491 [Tremellales sp. Tagirdzhanova-0007]
MIHHHISITRLINAVDWTLIGPMLTQLLCLPVLILASQRSLSTYVAISSLSPPPPPLTGSVESSANGEAKAPPTWREKLFSRKAGKLCFLLNGILALMNLILISLPQFCSQSMLDGVWVILLGTVTASLLFVASVRLSPPASTVQYQRDPTTGFTYLDFHTIMTRGHVLRLPLAIGLSSAILATAYAGNPALGPIVPVAFLSILSTIRTPRRLAMKWPVMVALGLELIFIIITGIDLFASDTTNTESKSAELKHKVPSTWLVSIMMMFTEAVPLILPGVIAAITLRFDYSLTSSRHAVVPSTNPVPVPGRMTDYPAPLFSTAIVSLLFSIFGIHALAFVSPSTVDMQRLGTLVYAPIMIGSIAAHAWITGKLGAWWAYEETVAAHAWITGKFVAWWADEETLTPKDEEKEANDVEKSLDRRT